MDKDVKEYQEKYGDIPKDYISRVSLLILSLKTRKHKEMVIPMIKRALNITYSEIFINVYLVPKPTPRPRTNYRTKTFYVKGASDNKKRFYKFLDTVDLPQITTAVIYNQTSYLPFPSDMNKVERILAEMGLIRPLNDPDFDNLVKTYTDMTQSRLIFNDSHIIDGRSRKFYSSKPRVEMEIKYYNEHDSEYNELNTIKRVNKYNEKYGK